MGWKTYLGDVTSEGVLVALVDRLAVTKPNPHVLGTLLEGIPVGDLHGLAAVFVRVRQKKGSTHGNTEKGHGVPGEPGTLTEDIGAREERRSILLVSIEINGIHLLVQYPRDIVPMAIVGEGLVTIDGHVGRPVHVAPVHANNDQTRQDTSSVLLNGREPRGNEEVANTGDIVVEGSPGIEAHASPEASDHSESEVLRGNPRHPVEGAQSLEEVVGDPEVDEHDGEGVEEETVAGKRPAVDDLALPLWQSESSVERQTGENLGEDGGTGVHDESSQETGDTNTKELSGESQDTESD